MSNKEGLAVFTRDDLENILFALQQEPDPEVELIQKVSYALEMVTDFVIDPKNLFLIGWRT